MDKIAELYDTTQQNISQHIDSIYSDEELDREATNKKFLLVRTEGREMRQLESDFTRAVKQFTNKKGGQSNG